MLNIDRGRTQWPSEYLSTHSRIRIRTRNSPVSLITIAHERRIVLQNLVESGGRRAEDGKFVQRVSSYLLRFPFSFFFLSSLHTLIFQNIFKIK